MVLSGKSVVNNIYLTISFLSSLSSLSPVVQLLLIWLLPPLCVDRLVIVIKLSIGSAVLNNKGSNKSDAIR
jgi:hypothetical protein